MGIRALGDQLAARLLGRYPVLVRKWAAGRRFTAGDPRTPLGKPLAECRVAIVTTSGVHLRDQPPFDMKNPNGDPTFREIPDKSPRGDLTITHNYYDHRSADRDINVVFPLDRLGELAGEGRIAGRASLHLGFMGHIDGPLVDRLIEETAPEAARRLIAAEAGLRVPHPRLRALQPLGRADSKCYRGGGPSHRFNQPCPRDHRADTPAPGGISPLADGAPAGRGGPSRPAALGAHERLCPPGVRELSRYYCRAWLGVGDEPLRGRLRCEPRTYRAGKRNDKYINKL